MNANHARLAPHPMAAANADALPIRTGFVTTLTPTSHQALVSNVQWGSHLRRDPNISKTASAQVHRANASSILTESAILALCVPMKAPH